MGYEKREQKEKWEQKADAETVPTALNGVMKPEGQRLRLLREVPKLAAAVESVDTVAVGASGAGWRPALAVTPSLRGLDLHRLVVTEHWRPDRWAKPTPLAGFPEVGPMAELRGTSPGLTCRRRWWIHSWMEDLGEWQPWAGQ